MRKVLIMAVILVLTEKLYKVNSKVILGNIRYELTENQNFLCFKNALILYVFQFNSIQFNPNSTLVFSEK